MPTPFGTYIHVCTVTVLPQYHLRLKFDDDSEQTINLEPYLLGPLWSALRTTTRTRDSWLLGGAR